jgi:hypothetical protein
MTEKNAIFLTQSSSLEMFYHLMLSMGECMDFDKIGFYVTDSDFYGRFTRTHPDFESRAFFLLKEWEIVRDSRNVRHDVSLLREYEARIGRPYLWEALVADRRIYWGRKYSYSQDYRPWFDHDRMLAILQVGLQEMDRLFNDVKPDFIVSFQCVTLGDYLSYLFARSRDIPVLNLRPTRIQNYFYAGESVTEPSERLRISYEKFLRDGIEDSWRQKAVAYLEKVRRTNAMYEGVVPPSSKPPDTSSARDRRSPLSGVKKAADLLAREYESRFGRHRDDNHSSSPLGLFIGKKIVNPLRARRMARRFHSLYVKPGELPSLNYAFFPLHTEPEVTLSVYSNAYLNQIEAARLFSHNLPVGMKLLVKEHPWSVGKRPLGYYNKLLEIPNVMLADPAVPSRDLVSHARLITVIAGSIGLEGLMFKRPVVFLGGVPYAFLPAGMLRHAKNPSLVGHEIRDLLENYQYSEQALLSYIAAVMTESVPVDFYSRLLGRKGAYNPGLSDDSDVQSHEREVHMKALAGYLATRLCNDNRVDAVC